MARTNDDDLGPGLLALGALALGVGAVIAIWSASESPASRTEREAREHEEGTGIEGAGTSAVAVGDPDAGVTLWGPPASWSSERVGIEAGEPDEQGFGAGRNANGRGHERRPLRCGALHGVGHKVALNQGGNHARPLARLLSQRRMRARSAAVR